MSTEGTAFHKGEKILLKDASVGIMTHAMHYGTAVFEGIRGNWNSDKKEMVIFRLNEHYERLLRGANILRMNLPYTSEDLSNITVDLVKTNGYQEDVYIRPLAYKSQELVANLKLHELDDDISIIVVPFGAYIDNDKPINCQTSSWRRPEDTMMPTGVKLSGLYTTSILAKTEAVSANFDEAILLNHDGTVSEGSGENLFMIKNGEIITPTETDNCLLGITRDSIINIAANEEVIPELLQSNCNPTNIYNTVDKLLSDKQSIQKQVIKSQTIIKNFKTDKSSEIACSVIENYF